jgi:hypothetical protein
MIKNTMLIFELKSTLHSKNYGDINKKYKNISKFIMNLPLEQRKKVKNVLLIILYNGEKDEAKLPSSDFKKTSFKEDEVNIEITLPFTMYYNHSKLWQQSFGDIPKRLDSMVAFTCNLQSEMEILRSE